MFAIATQQDQYQRYYLTDTETSSRLEVIPSRGGIVTSWQVQSQELFYLDQERLQDPELSVRGGIPILFPICGNLQGDRYRLEEQSYKLKQHGFARDLAWEVVDQKTEDCASLTLKLASSEITKAVYPFDFEVLFTYQLRGNHLRIDQSYTNLSDETMPFATGLHPYFAVQDKTQLSFDIPATMYQDQKQAAVLPFADTFDFSQPEIDAIFKSIKRHSVSFTDAQRGLTLNLNYSDHYEVIVFWTLQDKNFICLEPWSSPRNALNTGERLLVIDPKETIHTVVEFTANFS
ncbi:MAG: aldose epimerase [Microcystaceae cyanobacterium]